MICTRRIGYLFPHPCLRVSPVGCPYCDNGRVPDPYRARTDRWDYSSNYDQYDDAPANIDFTQADGEMLVRPEEAFEDNLGES